MMATTELVTVTCDTCGCDETIIVPRGDRRLRGGAGGGGAVSTRTTNRNVRAALRFARQHPELAYDNRCDGCGALLDEQDYRLCGGCNDALDDGGHAGIGFYSTTPDGHAIHVNGARAMSDETLRAIATMADLAYEQYAPEHTRVAD